MEPEPLGILCLPVTILRDDEGKKLIRLLFRHSLIERSPHIAARFGGFPHIPGIQRLLIAPLGLLISLLGGFDHLLIALNRRCRIS